MAARRTAVIAASSGLVVAMGLPAQATELENKTDDTAKSASTEVKAVNNAALTVDTAKVSFEQETFTAEKAPEPKPEPEPESAASQAEPASRSTERSAPKAESKSSDSESAKPQSKSSSSVISIAKKYTGVPYVYGGTSPSGWDCSGFTAYVFKQVGVSLPRTSGAQKAAGRVVSAAEAKPGDLVWHPGHVGIYAGNGMMYDAGSPGSGTSYRSHSWMGSVTYIRVL
ncbi:NlpC/P60 family protein [Saxibacter everestensis]|uniref:NlpC/P60 family protein n=1 Tax=Saxibacter everestensis TaxID=2909229 RepID=A0ABY8QUK3_9MICO|nr:NlpC/P60 family protein [Brevibacteriaceae bacterium ZFBP1038]